MASPEGRRGEPTLGRPTDGDRTKAILAATSELLFEHGYDQLRMQHVADRAGVGTGAIYRRWETKEALVAEAIRSGPDPSPVLEPSRNPAADLRAQVHAKADLAATQPDLLPGLIAAMRAHPSIDAAMRQRYSIAPVRDALARVVGADHPHLELLAELVPAIALHRSALRADPIDPDTLTSDILALIGDLTDHQPRRQPTAR